MVNYNDGKIYKIINENNEIIYIGSTVQTLCIRYHIHKLKSPNNKIILIENYSCNSKEELCKKEQEVIDEHSDLLNIKRAFGIDESRRKEQQKERNKKYREKHKDKIKENHKEYYQNNKDKINEQNRQYYQKNKDKFIEQNRQYYQNRKIKLANMTKQDCIV